MFGGELDLLEFRLHELGDVVDQFVICEAALTHSGRPKALYFEENKARFARWSRKIVHVVAELDAHASHPWRREEQQRRFIRDALRERASGDDAIVMGDVDELVDRDALAALAERCTMTVTLGMPHAIYFANWWAPKPWGAPPIFGRGSRLDEPLMRSLLGEPHDEWDDFRQVIVDGVGVHVSYLGGADAIRKKFRGHPDTYLDTPRYLRPGFIEHCIEYGVHFEGKQLLHRVRYEDLPPLLRRLKEKAPHLLSFSPAPVEGSARSLSGYTWIRRSPRLPQRIVDWLDEHPEFVTNGAGRPLFGALDAVLRVRRRIRGRPDIPFFIPLESPVRNWDYLRKHPQLLAPIHLSLEQVLRRSPESRSIDRGEPG